MKDNVNILSVLI